MRLGLRAHDTLITISNRRPAPLTQGFAVVCCTNVLADTMVAGVDLADPSDHLDLEPTPGSVRAARAFIKDRLGGLDRTATDAATLCASELVTNGVLHARTPIVIGVTFGRDQVLVTVGDKAPGRPEPPPPDDERPSGRGLLLVDALATQWGVHEEDDGKTVWFTVPRSGR